MSLSRAASSRFVCLACQRKAAPSSTLPLIGRISRASQKSALRPIASSRSAFSTSTTLPKDQIYPALEDLEYALIDDATETSTTAVEPPAAPAADAHAAPPDTDEPASNAHDPSVPWYLRQHPVVRDQRPADIPDLPPSPPPLLNTILEYISITAGLDDLQLLDLRNLDPPPALGSKLIMIIATARSEKHLHVSADRFARWLRREHGLKANAAGLLGRNELKIKLRRKAKRMRMLANVGGTLPEGNIDDGIRTGWICCTLSKIDAHPDDMYMPGDNAQGFIGFRDIKPGVNVVVQMFTEEKRAETDLETLWGGVLKSHQRHDKAAEEKLEALDEDLDVDDAPLRKERNAETNTVQPPHSRYEPPIPVQPVRRPQPTPGDFFPPGSTPGAAHQLRRLHTVGLR